MPAPKITRKAEETAANILDSALELFRETGFEKTTMRDIAVKAGVATGAAYYYYPSKEAVVLAFYQRASNDMEPEIERALATPGGLESQLAALIRVKLDYFAPNRGVLRALLRTGADSGHPLSPFSSASKEIRDADIDWFRRIVDQSGIGVPKDLKPELPGVLWFMQMGVILFWVTDESAGQDRTARLVALSVKIVGGLIRLAALPLTRPLRKTALELISIVKGDG